MQGASCLIRRDTISQDLIVSYGVVSLSTTVAGIAFYCVYDTVLDPFDDTSVIRKTVLRTGAAFVISVG